MPFQRPVCCLPKLKLQSSVLYDVNTLVERETELNPPTACMISMCSEKNQSQSSQMVSRSRSALRSPPQTLHLFLLLSPRLPKPKPKPDPDLAPGMSRLPRRLVSPSPALSTASAAFNLAARSDSIASHSRSGVSSIVSSEDTLGDRERVEVGVEGTLEKDEVEKDEVLE